jgi:23S rRNA (uridine2552-2'-O)-methyltransferase
VVRTIVGKAWVKRRRHDPFYRAAKAQGYRSRAAFKLIQADARFDLIYEEDTVVDLGAAPGGWTQVAHELVGDAGRVVAVDRVGMMPIAGVDVWRADLEDPTFLETLAREVDTVDVVVSDMAPRLSGNRTLDHARSVALGRLALGVARRLLREGGNFLCKVLEGEDYREFLDEVGDHFQTAQGHTPEASTKASREIYVVGKGFRARSSTRPATSRARDTAPLPRGTRDGRAPRRDSARPRRISGGS